jgi:hypothetical protein
MVSDLKSPNKPAVHLILDCCVICAVILLHVLYFTEEYGSCYWEQGKYSLILLMAPYLGAYILVRYLFKARNLTPRKGVLLASAFLVLLALKYVTLLGIAMRSYGTVFGESFVLGLFSFGFPRFHGIIAMISLYIVPVGLIILFFMFVYFRKENT